MKEDSLKYSFNYYLTAFALFSVIPAYYVWNSVWYSYLIVIAAGMCVIDIISHGTAKNRIFAALLFSFMMAVYIIRANLNIFGAIEVICVIPFFFVKKEFLIEVYNAFLRIFALAAGVGLVFYVLAVWLGINLPNSIIDPLNVNKILTYYHYPFFITEDGIYTPLNIRFFGMFDEPGVVGTICAILLLAEQFNLKKWENVIVLIAGIMSFSLFFFLICGVCVIITAPTKYKILVFVGAGLLLLLLYNNEVLYNVFFHRFNVEDGTLEGMNREHGDFATFYERFRQSQDYWLGLGAGTGEKMNEGGSSYKQIIVNYGVIFFVVYLFCFYSYAIGIIKGWRVFLIYSLLFLGTMYQRPFIGTPTFTFLMVISLYLVAINYSKNSLKYGKTVGFNNSTIV